jgi:hypothetical protein
MGFNASSCNDAEFRGPSHNSSMHFSIYPNPSPPISLGNITSQLTLECGTALPGVAGLEFRPGTDGAGLYAQIALPAILGFEVAHALDLLFPAVPHRHVRQGLAGDDETLRSVLGHHERDQSIIVLVARWGVDPVCLGGEGEGGGGFSEGLCIADLVDVRGVGEAFHGGFVDVLFLSKVKIFSMFCLCRLETFLFQWVLPSSIGLTLTAR